MNDRTIPSWCDYFLGQAFLTSQRSPDKQTQCGCVIANGKNQIVGQGYNGFPRGLLDSQLPDTRPEKYDWMIHAEVNAVLNSNGCLDDCTAYITTMPCFNCTLLMWQAGIKKIMYAKNGKTPSMINNDSKYSDLMDKLKDMSNIKMVTVQANLEFISNFLRQH